MCNKDIRLVNVYEKCYMLYVWYGIVCCGMVRLVNAYGKRLQYGGDVMSDL